MIFFLLFFLIDQVLNQIFKFILHYCIVLHIETIELPFLLRLQKNIYQINDFYRANFEEEVTNTLQALVTDSKYLSVELTDVIHDYSKCIVEYLSTPHKSLRVTYNTVLQSVGS
jgi:hypothetical protein